MKLTSEIQELETPFKVSELLTFINQGITKFDPLWQEAQRNEKRWIGDNYSDAERQRIKDQDRHPYSFGQARTRANRTIGIQSSQRGQFNVLAKSDPNDEVKAELAKLQMHAVEKRCDFPNLETAVFTGGMVPKYGVSKMGLSYKDIFPRVVVYEVDYLNFMWDPNCTSYNLNDDFNGALWVCEADTEYRKTLAYKYGYKGTLVENLKEGQFATFQGRRKLHYYVTENKKNHEYDIVTLFNLYIKAPRTYYYVIFEDTSGLIGNSNVIESKYNSRKEAEEHLRELQLPYLMQGLPLEGSIEEKDGIGYDKYIFTYDKVLEYEKTELEMFPYDVYRAIHLGDNFCSFMDLLRDPQIWYDRFIMQIDYALGKDNKVAKELDVTKLANGETPETALQKIEEGKTILKRGVGPALSAVEMKGVNPQWFQILDILTMVFEDLSNGQQFNAKANAADSGRKVEALVAQGGLGVKPFFDNLRRWKVGVGKNIISWMKKYEVVQDIIRIEGGALTPQMIELLKQDELYEPSKVQEGAGYVTLNKGDLTYLKDAEFELEVTEEPLSETEQAARLQNALDQLKIDPMLQQSLVYREYIISQMQIPADLKYKLLAELKQIQQANQANAEAQRQMANRKLDIDAAKVINTSPKGTFAQQSAR